MSFLGFRVTLSILLSWSFCLGLISFINFLEANFSTLSHNLIGMLAVVGHFSLTGISSLLLAYYKDIYSGFIILLFQIGIVVRHSDLNSKENIITLVLCLYTALSLAYTIFIERKRLFETQIEKDEVSRLMNNYNENALNNTSE